MKRLGGHILVQADRHKMCTIILAHNFHQFFPILLEGWMGWMGCGVAFLLDAENRAARKKG